MFGDIKNNKSDKGIAPRAIIDTLKLLDTEKYNLELSMFEIYSNKIKDLTTLHTGESKKESMDSYKHYRKEGYSWSTF